MLTRRQTCALAAGIPLLSIGGAAAARAAPFDGLRPPAALFGPRRLLTAWRGATMRLRRADGAERDIVPLATGDLDWADIAAWAGGADPGIVTLHDQTGNGRHATATRPDRSPRLSLADRVCAFGDGVWLAAAIGSGEATGLTLACTARSPAGARNAGLIALGRGPSAIAGIGIAGDGSRACSVARGAAGRPRSVSNGREAGFWATWIGSADLGCSEIALRLDGNPVLLAEPGLPDRLTTPTAMIGSAGPASPFTGAVAAAAFYLEALAGPDLAELDEALFACSPYAAFGRVVSPEMFDAAAGTGGDDRAAIQAAIDHLARHGGGEVRFKAPRTYAVRSASDYVTSGGPNLAGLIVRTNNVGLIVEEGARLLGSSERPMGLVFRSGEAKASHLRVTPTPRDSRNCAGTFNARATAPWELLRIEPASRGQQFVRLVDESDAAKLRVGDWAMLRAGRTLNERWSYETPFGQYSRIVSVAGREIGIDRPLVWPLAATRFPEDHESAGREVPWGIINLSWPVDGMLEGFAITGHVEMRGHAKHRLVSGNFSQGDRLGTEAAPLVVESDGSVFSTGFSRGSAFVRVLEAGTLMTSGRAWVVCNDACNHETRWDVVAEGRSLYIHMHEGTTGHAVVARLHASRQDRELAGFRAFTRDCSIRLSLDGLDRNPAWPAVRLDRTVTGIRGTVEVDEPDPDRVLMDDGADNALRITRR